MKVPVEIKPSPHHGWGVFAKEKILKGVPIWSYSRIFDHVIPQHVLVRAPKDEQKKLLVRGYRNPHNTEEIVMCGDEAQFMNFPPLQVDPNVIVSGNIDGFDILVASKDIEPGEELLVEAASDLDYTTKMLGYAPVTSGESRENREDHIRTGH